MTDVRARWLMAIMAAVLGCSSTTPDAEGTLGAPTNLNGTAGDREVSLIWTAPYTAGDQVVLSYTVTSTTGGVVATTAGATEVTIGDLINDTDYTFTVHANTKHGAGPESQPSPTLTPTHVTPSLLPGAPIDATATAGLHSATIVWRAPASAGFPILKYTVTPYLGETPGAPQTITSGLTATFSDLVPEATYNFHLEATNVHGTGRASITNSVTIPRNPVLPDPPTDVVAVRGLESAVVQWTAPVNVGDSPIIGYKVTASPGGFFATTTGATLAVVVSLTSRETYTFTVHATTAVGDSVESAPSAPITLITVPDPPASIAVVPGSHSAVVSWTAPPSDGGDPVASYFVSWDLTAGGEFQSVELAPGVFSTTVNGLQGDKDYRFQISAANAAGAGNPATSVIHIPNT